MCLGSSFEMQTEVRVSFLGMSHKKPLELAYLCFFLLLPAGKEKHMRILKVMCLRWESLCQPGSLEYYQGGESTYWSICPSRMTT